MITAASRGSLRRVLRSLTATLSGLGVSFGRGEAKDMQPGVRLDYSSLVSLSNSSQADAVRAMTDLSSRISSQSSVCSLAVSSSRLSKRSKQSKRGRQSGSSVHHHSRPTHRNRRDESSKKDERPRSRGHSDHVGPEQPHRLSRITMSSASTKLGEVRGHGRHNQGSVAAYPRRSLEYGERRPIGVDGGKRRKKWWHF